jgi:hypothetical protein
MSAFVIDEKAMHKVVKGFKLLQESSSTYWNNKLGLVGNPDWDKMGCVLFSMNTQAVNERYREENSISLAAFTYKFKDPFCSKVEVVKAMQCLRYQCSEGHVPDTPLYALLDHAVGSMAEKVVKGLPEYESAAWG